MSFDVPVVPDPTGDASATETTARHFAELYADFSQRIAAWNTTDDALTALTALALETVPGADHASITRARGDHFQTLAPTDDIASNADYLQYALDSGPCVDSLRVDGPFLVTDLVTDHRWPEFGPRAASEFGISSMLSIRMTFDDDIDAGLNLYGDDIGGFTARSETIALVLSTHGALAVSRVMARERAVNLEKALTNSRRIGMAIGVLMSARKLTDEQAFDLMRIVSQKTNRRMPLVADTVIETGTLDVPQQSEG